MFHSSYTHKQKSVILPHLSGAATVLDFGCGDLSLARAIKDTRPTISITGVDVVDAGVRYRDISFRIYDGRKLPFRNRAFDATIVYHVLHHCDDPKVALAEVARVTQKHILIVEPVYRHAVDLFFMKILDRVNNGWRTAAIPMPFTFQTENTWKAWGRLVGWRVQKVLSVGVLPEWLPVGVTKLFVLTR